jgi:hypothetical protein
MSRKKRARADQNPKVITRRWPLHAARDESEVQEKAEELGRVVA